MRCDPKYVFQRSPSNVGLLHATPPEHLFDALMASFHAATTPLVAGWHLGMLVGMPEDPQRSNSAPADGGEKQAGGWPPAPPRDFLVTYQTFNQVLRLAEEIKMTQLSGLPQLPVAAAVVDSGPSAAVALTSAALSPDDPQQHSSSVVALASSIGKDGLRRTRRRLATVGTQTPDQQAAASSTTASASVAAQQEDGKPPVQKGASIRRRCVDGEQQQGQRDDTRDNESQRESSAKDQEPEMRQRQQEQLPNTTSIAIPPGYGPAQGGTQGPDDSLGVGPPPASVPPWHHPAMSGLPQQQSGRQPWHGQITDPLPKGLTLQQLEEEFIAPFRAPPPSTSNEQRHRQGLYQPPSAPDPGSLWAPTFEPWREWRAAGGWVPNQPPTLGHRGRPTVEAHSVNQFSRELYLHRARQGLQYHDGVGGGYVAPTAADAAYSSRSFVLEGPDLIRAQEASWAMHQQRGHQAGAPAAAQRFVGQRPWTAGTWPGMAASPLPPLQLGSEAQMRHDDWPAGSRALSADDGDNEAVAGGAGGSAEQIRAQMEDLRQAQEDLQRFKIQKAISEVRGHHRQMTGAPAPAPPKPLSSEGASGDSLLYDAFPDPLANWEQFVRCVVPFNTFRFLPPTDFILKGKRRACLIFSFTFLQVQLLAPKSSAAGSGVGAPRRVGNQVAQGASGVLHAVPGVCICE